VLNEEQDREQSVPKQYVKFRGFKADEGNGSNEEKYPEKKERSSADEDGKGHHGVWDKLLHKYLSLRDHLPEGNIMDSAIMGNLSLPWRKSNARIVTYSVC